MTTISVAGKTLACPHCGGQHFVENQALVNTATMTLFKLDWLDKSASVFICQGCGRMEWFLNPGPVEKEDMSKPTTCLACQAEIPAEQDRCPKCGWSYKE